MTEKQREMIKKFEDEYLFVIDRNKILELENKRLREQNVKLYEENKKLKGK